MMTDTQKQCLLAFLGYYPGAEIDGVWGPKSEEATRAFQKAYALAVDGIFGADTEAKIREAIASRTVPEESREDWWEEIEFFTKAEFKCKCGGKYCSGYPAQMQKTAVLLADRARRYFGKPGHVVSGLRCARHNANSGGVANSQHMYGEAVDLRIEGVIGAQLLAFLQAQPEVRYAYQINTTNVHFDIPKGAR